MCSIYSHRPFGRHAGFRPRGQTYGKKRPFASISFWVPWPWKWACVSCIWWFLWVSGSGCQRMEEWEHIHKNTQSSILFNIWNAFCTLPFCWICSETFLNSYVGIDIIYIFLMLFCLFMSHRSYPHGDHDIWPRQPQSDCNIIPHIHIERTALQIKDTDELLFAFFWSNAIG